MLNSKLLELDFQHFTMLRRRYLSREARKSRDSYWGSEVLAKSQGAQQLSPQENRQVVGAFFHIGEYNTSKLCPCCLKPLERFGKKGYRLWQCKHGCKRGDGDGALVVNKDRSACLNFLRIMTCLMVYGERLSCFKNIRGMNQAAFTKNVPGC